MRLRHNKKRNTAFLYEALLRELTKSVIKQNKFKIKQIGSIIKENFSKETLLFRELNIYKPLYETSSIPRERALRLIQESRLAHEKLDKRKIFDEQTSLIKTINKTLGGSVFKSFIPNYKNIASIHSIFNLDLSPKDKIILEEKIEALLTSSAQSESMEMDHIDDIVYKSFVNKFNDKYGNKITESQKILLNKYISSFNDNGLELKVFINEELEKLKKEIKNSYNSEVIKEDEDFTQRLEKVEDIILSFREEAISESSVRKVLKIQNLVNEITTDAS